MQQEGITRICDEMSASVEHGAAFKRQSTNQPKCSRELLYGQTVSCYKMIKYLVYGKYGWPVSTQCEILWHFTDSP